jgi:phosphonate transport system permease protein
VLPQVLPQLVTFLLHRWEVVLRASIVVGFITGAGLGFALRLDLAFRRWTDVALVLLTYVLLVWAVDLSSSLLRRLAR